MFFVRHGVTADRRCVVKVRLQRPWGLRAGKQTSAEPLALPLPSLRCDAIVDTGSNRTYVRADVARRLSLEPTGFERVTPTSIGEPTECWITYADVSVEGHDQDTWVFPMDLVISQAPMTTGLVLGMDALESGVLTVDLIERWWSFQTP